ncbi:MAG: aldehyde dehydrogenase family protein [Acidimicrobiia bacterium]|nr:aldehyde dehydrogenase family protein [Acidimicrobiia bacterium]
MAVIDPGSRTTGGADASSGERDFIAATDPRTGERLGLVPDMTPGEVQAAVAEARIAASAWAGVPYRARAEHILRVRDLLLDRLDEAIETICAETGKLGVEALTNELLTACETIEFYARKGEKALRPERVSAGLMGHKKALRVFEPLGVVGVISPWNYPFILTMTPVITALFAGNTVVVKPSEVTPLTGRFIGELFEDAGGHPGIVRVVTGGGATGEALVRSGVDKICFTGSVRTGQRVMAAAADTLTPVLLELGGKDPMIVCADADIERAASGAVWGAFQNSGQTCMSVERVYVVDEVYDAFVDGVVRRTEALRQGMGRGHDIGSMTFPPQLDVVADHLDDAVRRGARILTGGKRVPGRPGLWFEPTVVVDVDHRMKLLSEETFGPVLPIMAVADEEEALRLANDSDYGLNSSVWTRDLSRGRALATRVHAGNVCVNDVIVSYGVPGLPFGGTKTSGIGRVHGLDGLREFSQSKSILVDRFGLAREAWWYPVPGPLEGLAARTMQLRYRRGLANKARGIVRPRRRTR